ncbi:MAG: metallophosphoesterase [Bacteroidales bacterium]|nr:metallophosphoesterase [Bacteroidales bacterium]
MKRTHSTILTIGLLCLMSALHGQSTVEIEEKNTVKFVSFPDFFNFDIPEPWPEYDSAVDYFLTQVKSEDPDFVLITGDLVNGHWWDSPRCIEHMGAVYYTGWIRRMQRYGLKYYTAIGDHELGDDPWPEDKRRLVSYFQEVYNKHLMMPDNGPDYKKGLAYFVRKGDLLLVTLEPFEIVDDSMRIDVRGEQLEWFRKVLTDNKDAKFKVVQCHVGLWGDLKDRSSSRLFIENGKEGDFYKTMKEFGVDLYLAGEFHAVTILESDGIWEIVHGSSWGRKVVDTEDYLVGEVCGDTLKLQMKCIYMDAKGGNMWNLNKDKGPQERVEINEKTLKNGPEITGTLTIINKNGNKTYTNKTGYFIENEE